MSGCHCETEAAVSLERRVLWTLMGINAAMLVGEASAGWLGQSTGLMADSLDMLSDASVYGIALGGVGRSRRHQVASATVSGILQIGLGLGVLFEVGRRSLQGSDPTSVLMMTVGAVALAANVTCLLLIAKHRDGGVHMRASWIFSANDVIANLGVMVSGVLVYLLQTRLPDLLIGGLIAALVTRGGVQILREARHAQTTTACAGR